MPAAGCRLDLPMMGGFNLAHLPSLVGVAMVDSWKVNAFSLASTLGVAYVSCAIFDALFPPYGMLVGLASTSPWPITGSPLGYLTGFVLFVVAGFALGAVHGIASGFWSNKLK